MQSVATVSNCSNFSSRRLIRILSLLTVLAGLLLFAGNAGAAPLTLTWSTIWSADWATSSAWRSGHTSRVPTAEDTACLGAGNYLTTSTKIEKRSQNVCKRLLLARDAHSRSTIVQDKKTTGGSTELRVMENAYIGYHGRGTFHLKSSAYSNFNVLKDEYVGYFNGSLGNLMITGEHAVTGNLYMGHYSGATGQVSLTSGGTVSARGEHIGGSGKGTFTQSGGTNTVGTSGLTIGVNSGSEGEYRLSGGLLLVDAAKKTGDVFIGRSGKGTFTQTGGSAYFYDKLYMSAKTGAQSTYDLSQRGRLFGTTEYIGYAASALFRQKDATSYHRATDNVYIGYGSGVNGTYLQHDGRVDFKADEIVGYNGVGNVRQYYGTHAVTNNLILGQNAGSTGTYTALNGTLSAGTLIVGEYGTGTFYQYSGTNTPGTMYLGKEAASKGTYELNGSSAQLTAGKTYVGNAGSGTFKHTAGTAQVSTLIVGGESGGYGSYSLSGSSSSLTTSTAHIGHHTVGKVSHTGGTHTNNKTLMLGTYDDGNGSYYLSGAANLVSRNEVIVGYMGRGFFGQKGGTHTIGRRLVIGAAADGDGTYDFNGGTLTSAGTAYMTVRNHADAEGVFKGSGVVGLSGLLTNNGQVIANRSSQALDFSGMSGVANTIENDGAHGWYAENGAELILPTLNIATATGSNSSYNWGESQSDTLIDLVNSVTMDFDNVYKGNTLSISLLDTAHGDVAAGLTDMLGVWNFDANAHLCFSKVALGFRFDDALLGTMTGLNSVELYHYDGSAWNDITGYIDSVNHIVYGYRITDFSNFAVVGTYKAPGGGTAIPEPATILLFSAALITLGGRALKRRHIR